MLDLRFFTNFEWNERRKNPDIIEIFRDFVCVLVAEGGNKVRYLNTGVSNTICGFRVSGTPTRRYPV